LNVSIGAVTFGAGTPRSPWKWTVYIVGDSKTIEHVKCVQYLLDPSFPVPSRTVCSRGAEYPYFPSNGTMWGRFKLSATVTFDDGSLEQLEYAVDPLPTYQRVGWHPIDITFGNGSTLFVLDDRAKISRVVKDESGIHLETLPFDIPLSYGPVALAATENSVFVSTDSALGCTVFQYSLVSKKTSRRLLGITSNRECDGIATDGAGIFLVFPASREIRYWPDFSSQSSRSWPSPVPGPQPASGNLNFNQNCGCLIFSGASGAAYSLSLKSERWSTITDNLGFVHSVASDSSHILFASGNKVLFYSTANNRRENPPLTMQSLTGGLISGVAIDTDGSAWIADFDIGVVQGPIPLG
jgi:YEATS family